MDAPWSRGTPKTKIKRHVDLGFDLLFSESDVHRVLEMRSTRRQRPRTPSQTTR
jgi:hypothetical protein